MERLLNPRTSVFVHVDRRTAPQANAAIVDALPKSSSVHLVPRVKSGWASWGIVEAMLVGLRSVLNSGHPANHIVILSGHCYPLRSAAFLVDFFARFPNTSFVDAWRMPWDEFGPDGGMHRLLHWHMPIAGRRFRIPISRRYPPQLSPYTGTTWMVLDRATARRLIEINDARPDIARYHRHVWIPDEHYIPTVLYNFCAPETLCGEALWYQEWARWGKHPRTFVEEDFSRIVQAATEPSVDPRGLGPKLFARKFDLDRDRKVLDLIDRELLQ